MSLENGKILNGTYRLMEEIGSGGGGIVYKAYHERLKKYVVIKRIRDRVKGVLESRAEVDILKNLSHTYLPQVFDFLETDGEIYTVIDFIPGVSLEKALEEEGRFDQKEVLKWANQLAQALAYLHSQNPAIVHSDIKPANIMLRPNRDICLIDFNVSLAFDAGMRTSIGVSGGYSPPEQYWNYEMYCSVTGTSPEAGIKPASISQTKLVSEEAGNMGGSGESESQRVTKLVSPEPTLVADQPSFSPDRHTKRITQLVGRGVDERSDIYSLGATLYHLLTGQAPTDDFEQIVPISRCGIQISEGFALIIEKMMELFPENRYQNGMELLHALENIQELDSVYRGYKRRRRIGGACVAGMYAVSALLLLTGISTISREQNSAYNHEIQLAEDSLEAENFDAAQDYIEAARRQMPARIDSYEKELQKLYIMADYEGCIRYGKEILNSPPYEVRSKSDKTVLGNVFYIMGNAYYEEDDLANALSCFSSALEYNTDYSLYYRDYSIALAKSGNLDQAEQMLEKAVSLGIGQDSIYLVQGELAHVRGMYQEAVELFQNTLNITEDSHIRRRCVLLADRGYQMLGPGYLDEEVQFLETWEQASGERGSFQITERLADAYTRQGEYEKALLKFQGLMERGYSTYQMWYNLSVLHQQLGEFEEAEEILKDLLERYPGHYETYKRLAFFEADVQQTRENAQRDYHRMAEYYEQAVTLYETQKETDEEMQVLQVLMEDVKAGHWLD